MLCDSSGEWSVSAADWISARGCMRCVWAEDECLFNQSVSVGTRSGGLLTTIWTETEEEQMRKKTLSHPVGSEAERAEDECSQQVIVINTFQHRGGSLTAIPRLSFPGDLLQVVTDTLG